MINIKENTTIIGISELRTQINEALEASKKHKVLLVNRNNPVGVLVGIERYNKMEAALETLEDLLLSMEAQAREKKSKVSDYIDIEEAIKLIR